MTHKTTFALAFALTLGGATGALAAHNNPWATAEDTVLAKNHDAYQAARPGTGEDRMLGDMVQAGADRGGNRGGTDGGSASRGEGGNGGGNGGGKK